MAKVVCISYTPFRLLDLRHFFATRKEVMDKASLRLVGASRTILYTDTSGQTWTRQAIPANVPPDNFLDVLAISETEAWVVGEDGVMLRTTNSGQTWVLQPSLTTRDLWSIAMTAPNDIWVAGASGTIFHYDGQNWTSGIGATGEHLNSISPTPFFRPL